MRLDEAKACLNAPFGAQCFPTRKGSFILEEGSVSMHLLVLSAFRPYKQQAAVKNSCVSMHLLVLSAFRLICGESCRAFRQVSMHLLVLSAFRLENGNPIQSVRSEGLNAPFGAQCFPTKRATILWSDCLLVSMHLLVLSAFRPVSDVQRLTQCRRLNAPFGAQCFPTYWISGIGPPVSRLNAPFGAQCFPTDRRARGSSRALPSQCTFWCSVLSDDNDG